MKWNICLFISCSRYDSTWWQFMNQPKQSCVNIMELIVYYAYMTVWTFLYLWIYLFLFLFPNLCCVPRAYFMQILLRLEGYCEWWGCWNHRGYFHCTHGCYFYCTLPRQFILHLHPYNILRFLWGTQFWVSRSKKCLVRKWQYLVFSRYFLTTYIIPFLSADVWKKADKKRLFVVSLFLFSF